MILMWSCPCNMPKYYLDNFILMLSQTPYLKVYSYIFLYIFQLSRKSLTNFITYNISQ